MRLLTLLLLAAPAMACELDPSKYLDDGEEGGGDDMEEDSSDDGSDDDSDNCGADEPKTEDDDCDNVVSIKFTLPTIRKTIRIRESIGATDPSSTRGEGPIPFDFFTSGPDVVLAAGAPPSQSTHSYDVDAIRDGADGLADAILVEADGSSFGAALADAGDFFGTGTGSFLVGAPGLDAVFMFDMGAEASANAGEAAGGAYFGAEGSEVGTAIVVGNFAGDGLDVAVFQAPGLGDHGGLYVLPALAAGSVELDEGAVQLLGTGSAALDGALVNLGDLDGDGDDELGVGSISDSRFSVFLGGEAWATDGATADAAAATLLGTAGDGFGTAAAALGDGDGDGILDVIVGAPDDSTRFSNGGAVYLLSAETLLSGGEQDAATVATQTWFGEMANAAAGVSVAGVGDVTGDGLPDAIVGSPGMDDLEGNATTGALHVVSDMTRTGYINRAGFTYTGAEAGDRLGTQVAGGVDVDGDGIGEVAALAAGVDDLEVLLSGG